MRRERERQSVLREAVTGELVSLGLVASAEAIASWDVWPNHPCDVAVRVHGVAPDAPGSIDSASSLICELQVAGQYLNIRLRPETLVRLVTSTSFELQPENSTDLRAAIEHTSLTPAYPINLATFRSTAIGVALAGLLRTDGYDPTSYFWVEDEAAQMRLLHEAVNHVTTGTGATTEFPQGKPDHVLGRLLVQARHAMQGLVADEQMLSRMFPEAPDTPSGALTGFTVVDPYTASEAVRTGSTALARRCLSGFSDTFERAGVVAPQYVLGSVELHGERLTRAWDWQRSYERESAAGPAYLTEAGGPSYLIRNVAWFDWLAEKADKVVVVAPARQEAVVDRALAIVRHGSPERTQIVHVPFGDVLNGSGALDRPTEGRFTSVDGFLAQETDRLGWAPSAVAASLRLFLLTRNPRDQIVVPDDDSVHASARTIHRLFTVENDGRDSARMLRACKRLLDLGHVVDLATARLDPSLIVRELEALARDAAVGCSSSVREAARRAVRCLLELLDFKTGVS